VYSFHMAHGFGMWCVFSCWKDQQIHGFAQQFTVQPENNQIWRVWQADRISEANITDGYIRRSRLVAAFHTPVSVLIDCTRHSVCPEWSPSCQTSIISATHLSAQGSGAVEYYVSMFLNHAFTRFFFKCRVSGICYEACNWNMMQIIQIVVSHDIIKL